MPLATQYPIPPCTAEYGNDKNGENILLISDGINPPKEEAITPALVAYFGLPPPPKPTTTRRVP